MIGFSDFSNKAKSCEYFVKFLGESVSSHERGREELIIRCFSNTVDQTAGESS